MQLSDITIVVPTRNEAHNIPAFLNSIPAQLQLIVVDASEDATPDRLMELRPNHTTLIHHPGNVTVARQVGAEAAATDWLLFTDADVVFAQDYFTRLPRRYAGHALYGAKIARDQYPGYYRWFTRGQQWAHRVGIPAVSGSNFLVHRHAFAHVGGFDLRLTCNEDSELGWRIRRRGFQIDFAPELVVYARDHRRLERGAAYKMVHSVTRCLLLYTGLLPDRWRSHDWGYWSDSRTTQTPPTSNASNQETVH